MPWSRTLTKTVSPVRPSSTWISLAPSEYLTALSTRLATACAIASASSETRGSGASGVMKKCTLCIDRIYNENIPEVDREPACVRTCPAGARHFGDLSDPDSAVSQLVAERGGFDLMPEMGTAPVNKYLPPRPKTRPQSETHSSAAPANGELDGFLGWLDRALEKLG